MKATAETVEHLARTGLTVEGVAASLGISRNQLLYLFYQGRDAKEMRAAYNRGRRASKSADFAKNAVLEMLNSGHSIGVIALALDQPYYSVHYRIFRDPALKAAFDANRSRPDRVTVREVPRFEGAEDTWAEITGIEPPAAPVAFRYEGPFVLEDLFFHDPLTRDERAIRAGLITISERPKSVLSYILDFGPRTLPGIMRLTGWDQREASYNLKRGVAAGRLLRVQPPGEGLSQYKKNVAAGDS